ncbi:hypothetical protein AB5J55_34680 [Streptomyces sp. R11]|uniref:Zinc-binding dehydrogenase n=1 Tax=Streptomyces sp. R11 TaxID=3238625 RepID=A0AB39NAB6_9ACTN
MAEVCDEARFFKQIDKTPLVHVRDYTGAGLCTAHQHEEEWGMAHRILLPAFSQRAMKAYYGQMLEGARNPVGNFPESVSELVRLTAAGRLDLAPSVSDRIPLADAADAVNRLENKIGDPIRLTLVPRQLLRNP